MIDKKMEDYLVNLYRHNIRDEDYLRDFIRRFFDGGKEIKEPWEIVFWTQSLHPDHKGSPDLNQSMIDFKAGWMAAIDFECNYLEE